MKQPAKLCMALLSMTALVLGETHEMVESMYMSRKIGTDLFPEATGFIFRKDNDGPGSYMELGARVVNKHLDKYPSEYYAYPLIPEVFARLQNPIPSAHEKGVKVHQEEDHEFEKMIVAPVQEESSESNEENKESHAHGTLYNDSDDVRDDYQKKFDGYKGRLSEFDNFNGYRDDNAFHGHGLSSVFEEDGYGRGFGSHEDIDSHSFGGHGGSTVDPSAYDGGKYAYRLYHNDGDKFTYGGGKTYNAGRYLGFGKKISNGCSGRYGFENGEDGHHDVKSQEENYTEDAGEEGGSKDESDEYVKHYSNGKENESENIRDNDVLSKGKKTTGFKNVYRKDDYEKNKEVYAKSDAIGHSNKHVDKAPHHDAAHESLINIVQDECST